MFSAAPDASKVALAYLVDMLRVNDFRLFDAQFLTDHLASLGAIEIPRQEYRRRLARALRQDARLDQSVAFPDASLLVQRITQTS